MIGYSRRAIAGLAFLFRPYNDLDIYVEDTAGRNLYEVLLGRILQGKARVTRIFQLGGKNEVIEASEQCTSSTRPALFIIDGDFDFLRGVPPPTCARLYRLNVYCCENLVVGEESVLAVAVESAPNTTPADLQASLAYNALLSDIARELRPLLVLYLACSSLATSTPTVSYNATALLENAQAGAALSSKKIRARISDIEKAVRQDCGGAALKAALESASKLYPDPLDQAPHTIPGKTYLLPLLYHHLRHHACYRGTLDQLKVRLARHCRLDIDPNLPAAVQRASKGLPPSTTGHAS